MLFYCGAKNASSWSLRAWLALKEAELAFDEVDIDLRQPARGEALAHVGRVSPTAAVPALIDGGTAIFDSLAIMEYANELGGGHLWPAEVKARAVARSLLAWQHSDVGRICPALSFESVFYPQKRQASEAEKIAAERLLTVWGDYLDRSGGPFLMGAPCLADLGFVPTVTRIFSHVEVPARWRHVKAWMDALLQRPAVVEWMAAARILPPVHLPDYLGDTAGPA